jgi:C1A family cysteine protease
MTAVSAACLALQLAGGLALAAEPLPVKAPPNPLFLPQSLSGGAAPLRLLGAAGGSDHPLGYQPGPVDYSYLQGQQIAAVSSGGYQPLRLFVSPQYDLRSLDKLTAVRDQGSCGDCWAFAALGVAESVLKPGETRDFSENNLKNTHGFDWGHCSGGNGDMATAYLARRSGPVNESDDPYNPLSNVSPGSLPIQKVIRDVVIIPPRSGALDNDAIKQAVMDYGAVMSTMYADGGITSSTASSYYNPTTYSYYYTGGYNSNHAIAIVGWDDNYAKSNFSTVPAGNGAFIIRNSWGAGWGSSGYFYLSYYDTVIGASNYQFRSFDQPTTFATIYQYDPLGKTSTSGYGSETAWFANVFTAAAAETVTAIGLHAASAGSTYDWYLYTGVSAGAPRSGTLAASGSGTMAAPGYHVVSVTPTAVTAGQKFSVVVRLTTPGYTFPVPLEEPLTGYTSQATAAAGQSYMSDAGSSWTDVTSYYANANVALKALSQYAAMASVSGGNGSIVSAATVYTGSGGSASFDLAPNSGYRPAATVSGSCPAGSFSGYRYTSGVISGNCTVGFSFVPTTTYDLTLAVSGASGGSVTAAPAPPGATCPGSCSQTFPSGEVVTLTPTAGAGALFSSWSGACSGSGACQVTMDGAKSVTANFSWQPNVKIGTGGSLYGLIGEAYPLLAGGEALLLKAMAFPEVLDLQRPVTVTLQGGYDDTFATVTGYSTIRGSLTVTAGGVTLDRIIIAP